MNNKIKEREIIETKATFIIETYKTFFVNRGTHKYLKNIEDFEISRLKLLARTYFKISFNEMVKAYIFKQRTNI
jgi:hypothetical protein